MSQESHNITPNAIVTGAGSGLGRELTHQLVQRGFKVHAIGRSAYPEGYDRVVNYLTDLCDTQRLSDIAATITRNRIDFVYLNAGSGVLKPLGELNENECTQTFAASLNGNISLVRQLLPRLHQQTQASIVGILSTAALVGKKNETVYCASKWGFRGFLYALKEECRSTNVKISIVYPAGMQTEFWEKQSCLPKHYEKFLSPREVARVILSNTIDFPAVYISELRIDRC